MTVMEKPTDSENKPIPSNFRTIISDMTKDLSTTFPEYAHLWEKWTNPALPEKEVRYLFEYCTTVYPERFFDLLYQSTSLFEKSNTSNTCFLPGVDFKLLFNCEGVSENTQKTMWKYLQLMLFTIVGSIHDKSKFGDSANLFDGVDETELHNKLSEAMESMSDFFKNMETPSNDSASAGQGAGQGADVNFEESIKSMSEQFGKFMDHTTAGPDESTGSADDSTGPSFTFNKDKMGGMPNIAELHGHIKSMFDGKIGTLAKELAEEISQDMQDILGEDGENIKSTADVLKTMMKNPNKIKGLIKTVGDKLNQKISSGEISQEELMKEAGELIGKMKDMGGTGADFQSMFKDMAKNMGVNIPKNAKVDVNAMDRLTKESSMRERLKNRLMMKKTKEAEAIAAAKAAIERNTQNYVPYDFSLEPTGTNKYVFKLDGEESQQTSSVVKPVNESGGLGGAGGAGGESKKKKKKKNKK